MDPSLAVLTLPCAKVHDPIDWHHRQLHHNLIWDFFDLKTREREKKKTPQKVTGTYLKSSYHENLVLTLFWLGLWPATVPFQLWPPRHGWGTCEPLELPAYSDCSPPVFSLLPHASPPLPPCARWLDSRCHGNRSCKKLNNIWMEGRGERGEGSGLSCSSSSTHVVFSF